ncbi:hypothetical protein LTR56_013396 [Elasticomyces elasticus]|nr:hypothetical protein LTR56_013396 [Elasticomyces elasticus]KAK3665709.1 hypothetical protein LTR22_003340 [Elasticomyces elasticus]KAK4910016.1 hypothetical protein LTR49_021290 [Elasticomyces elasticus]
MALSSEIFHSCTRPGPDGKPLPNSKPLLVYFITGNPGLIDYYETTLKRLFDTLRTKHGDTDLYVYGSSLPGFVVDKLIPSSPPYDLAQQIEHHTSQLLMMASKLSHERNGAIVPIVLIGHSIGTYMCLEIISRWQVKAAESRAPMEIVGGICLFPTVVDIAKSPTGRTVAPFLALPYSTVIAHYLVKIVFLLVPVFVLTLLVRLITGMESPAAKTTAQFLKSKHGVRQALYLAKHEMTTVAADKWTDSLWGKPPSLSPSTIFSDSTNSTFNARRDSPFRKRSSASTMPKPARTPSADTKLFFYWAKNDHWVADDTRDDLISTRGRLSTLISGGRRVSATSELYRPVMEVDEHGIPHAFPAKKTHSLIIGDKLAEYIDEISVPLRARNVMEG